MKRRRPTEEDSVSLILENSHLSDEALELYCLNLYPDDKDSSIVEEHLLICSYCQKRLEKAQEYISATKGAARRLEAEQSSYRRPFDLRIVALGTIAAGLACMAYFGAPEFTRPLNQPIALQLFSMRDGAPPAAPGGQGLKLQPDLSGLSVGDGVWLRLLDAQGKVVTEIKTTDPKPELTTPKLSSGRYWLRASSAPSGALLREFFLEVR